MGSEGGDRVRPDVDELVKRARALLSQGGTLESSSGSGPIADSVLVDAVTKTLGSIADPEAARREPDTAEVLAARKIVGNVRSTLNSVQGGASPSHLSEDNISALELIVHTIGRPALRYRNGRVETPPNKLGDNSRWFVLVATQRDEINRVSRCVGRLAREGSAPVLGTGWRLGKDLIVTNRHVAKELVTDRNAAPETWKLDVAKKPFIDFAYTDGTVDLARFDVGELAYCASTGDIDLAILRVLPGNAALPAAIGIDWEASALGREIPAGENAQSAFQGDEIYAVGHPYRLSATEQTRTVFDEADGRKRWSPGLVTKIEAQRPLLLHDSSTLGGNSGSCILSIGSNGHSAVGLHFGGKELDQGRGTGLGSTNYAVAFACLGKHPAVALLKQQP